MQVLLFISVNLFPRRESRGEGPAFNYEANAVKKRDPRVIGTPKGTRERVRIARWRGRESYFRGSWKGSWRRSGFSDVRGRGKIASWGEQRMRGGVIQVE